MGSGNGCWLRDLTGDNERPPTTRRHREKPAPSLALQVGEAPATAAPEPRRAVFRSGDRLPPVAGSGLGTREAWSRFSPALQVKNECLEQGGGLTLPWGPSLFCPRPLTTLTPRTAAGAARDAHALTDSLPPAGRTPGLPTGAVGGVSGLTCLSWAFSLMASPPTAPESGVHFTS